MPVGNGSGRPEANSGRNEKRFEPWQVVVKPGYILGPYGDEINIDCARVVDLRTDGVTGVVGEACGEASDPWCSEVFEQKDGDRLYIAVRYKEVATRAVRVQSAGCGCDETRCEYSRLRDGYEIAVLDYCPGNHAAPPSLDDLGNGPNPACPPCPDEPWVALAEVTLGDNGEVLRIDNCSCRRIVASFIDFWWHCESIAVESLSTETLIAGLPNQLLEITGRNLHLVDKINFGSDLELAFANSNSEKISGSVSVPDGTASGPRPMNVIVKYTRLNFTVKYAVAVTPSGANPQPGPPDQAVDTKPSSRRTRGKNPGRAEK